MDLSAGLLSVLTMNTERGVVYGVIGLVLATTLVSGPLVGAVDFTPAAEESSLDGGNATVGDVSLPATAEIRHGRFGSGEYYVHVPDATLRLDNVTGTPLLAYRFSIPVLGYSRSTTHFVTAADTGRYDLTLSRDAIEPSRVENRSYGGTVSVFLRSNRTERRLAERNVTVEVTG